MIALLILLLLYYFKVLDALLIPSKHKGYTHEDKKHAQKLDAPNMCQSPGSMYMWPVVRDI